ncbi:MAG: prepilin peptidase [Proteobacteria bacterium]|nr:prepilin peptidase [Pseudomonadota bacterium]
MLELFALAVFAGLLVFAALTDIVSLTIHNWVSIALAVLFAPIALATNMPIQEIGIHYLFGFGLLAVGFFLFQAHVIGGGDAKLLAGAAVWTGFTAFVPFIFWTTMAGGVIALGLLMARQQFAPAAVLPAFVNRLLTPKSGVPYGVAIMMGGLMALPSIPFAEHTLTLP